MKQYLRIIISAIFFLLLLRGFELQINRGDFFFTKAEDNRFFSRELPAYRGVILDRFHNYLVENTRLYYYESEPESLHSPRREISAQEALSLAAEDSIHLVFDSERHYTVADALAHTLGYTGLATAEEIELEQASAGQRLGKMGLESQYNKELQGIPGKEIIEINAVAREQRVFKHKEPKHGQSLLTTLDPYLSQLVYNEIAGENAVVIISDVETGAILSLVNSPSFDPNIMVEESQELKETRQELVLSWLKDVNKPFFNRAVQGTYPPGSVFKIVTALAGLQEAAFSANTTVLDEGILKVGDYEYGNWYFRQFGGKEGEIALVRAIARSNDIYFYKAAEWLGAEQLAEYARLFGFGKKTKIELAAEENGLVPDPAWKEGTTGERWFLGNTYHFGIGQGDLLVTPLQVLQLMQTVANAGRQCQPHLTQTSPECYELGFKEEHIQVVLEGMLAACSSGGTAYPFFSYNEQFASLESLKAKLSAGAVVCKTGTAEFGGRDNQGYRKTHAWWMGAVDLSSFFSELPEQKENSKQELSRDYELWQKWLAQVQVNGYPEKIAITVLVESDDEQPFKEGSRDAASKAKAIFDWILSGERVSS